jgi:hypothetical protein
MFFTDLHVQILSKGILEPGEQLLGQTVTSYMPWWAMGLINRQYLVLATDRRLILVDHRLGFFPPTQRLHAIQSITWQNVQELKVKGLFMKKKLRIKGVGDHGPVALTAVIPNAFFGLLAPMKNNMVGAKAVAAALQQNQAPQLAAPFSQPPAMPFQPPMPQLAGPYSQPPMPPQNAPGYTSAPPPAPQQAYGAPPPAPFQGQGYPQRWS